MRESSKRPLRWLKPLPPNVLTEKVSVLFKIAPEDVGKRPNDVINLSDKMVIYEISKNSFYNGLIMGDIVQKVNDATGRSNCQAELMKGETCTVEVIRRKGAVPATAERLRKTGQDVKPGHNLFILNLERPAQLRATAVGMKTVVIKKRCYITEALEDGIAYQMLGRGDVLVDIDHDPINKMATPDNTIRERLSKLSTGGKVTALVERPIDPEEAKDFERYIDSFTPKIKEQEVPYDVAKIGREASSMHFIILKKLTTPSCLSSDARRNKKAIDKTSEAGESNISISTASTEMKIISDVDDIEDLKKVVTKSHAAGNSGYGGAFDDE
ncbi:unnamed protein product [Caenorhabditis brenneri]